MIRAGFGCQLELFAPLTAEALRQQLEVSEQRCPVEGCGAPLRALDRADGARFVGCRHCEALTMLAVAALAGAAA